MKKYIFLFLVFFVYTISYGQRGVVQYTSDITKTDTIRSNKDTTGVLGKISVPDDTMNIKVILQDGVPVSGSGTPGLDTASVVDMFDQVSGYTSTDCLLTRTKIDSIYLELNKLGDSLASHFSDSSYQKTSAIDDSADMSGWTRRFWGTAGENLSAGDVVYTPIDSDSVIYKADADDTSKIYVIGIIKDAITATNKGYVYIEGIIEISTWTWQAGKTLYLDETTAGGISHSIPSNSPSAIIVLGRAIAPKKIYFKPEIGSIIYQ